MKALSSKESDCDRRTFLNVRPLTSRAAFSLLEIIAVLAILAILAAAILPAVIKQADFAAQNTETTNLVTFANAFQQGALRQRYLPTTTNWYAFIATNAGWQTNAVVINSRNNARVFLIDPSMTNGPSLQSLPYAQDANPSGLTNMPTNVRFILVSSMAQVGLPMSSGTPSIPDFNNLWATPDNTVPTNTSWNWSGFNQGSDVQIQRINLSGMFNHLILSNYDIFQPPKWTIGTTNTVSITGGTPNGYFLKTTPIGLYYFNVSTGYTLETVQTLLQDCIYTYQCGIWRTTPPISHQNIVGQFTNSLTPTNVTGVTPSLVCSNMISYMASYSAYAASGFSNTAWQATLQANQRVLSSNVNALSQ